MKILITSRQKGFSLVEVLIASTILAIGLLAVTTMIARSTIQDSRAYFLAKASMMIEEHFEAESNKQYTKKEFEEELNNSIITKVIDGITYTMTCTVKDETPLLFCKEMTCAVTWNNKGLQGNTSYAYDFCRY
jgi:prepilin-type N-terminal cleavage/methylation domain-containing protein